MWILVIIAGFSMGFQQATVHGAPVNNKGLGKGLGYGSGNRHGRQGEGYGKYGRYEHGGHSIGYGQAYGRKQVPIEIPYLDRNGCRFPGDVVCNPADTNSTTYGYCVLSDENQNLWKKPTMEIVVADCVPAGTAVLSDWCNDNERLLRAIGYIRNEKEYRTHYHHQKKYATMLNPCICVATKDDDDPYVDQNGKSS